MCVGGQSFQAEAGSVKLKESARFLGEQLEHE